MISAKWFVQTEFDSPDAPGSGAKMNPELIAKLDALRDACGFVFHINSAYRTADHNKKVGGVPGSAHELGQAVDISTVTGFQKFTLLKHAFTLGFTRVGIGSSFVHLDVDGTKPAPVVWTYPSGKNAGMA